MATMKPYRPSDVPQSLLAKLYNIFVENAGRDIHEIGDIAKKICRELCHFYDIPEPVITVTNDNNHPDMQRHPNLMVTKAWYRNNNIVFNVSIWKHDNIEHVDYYAILHEFRHHMQNNIFTLSTLRFPTPASELDAYSWGDKLLARVAKLPALRQMKLDADRRCRAKYPERYGAKRRKEQ